MRRLRFSLQSNAFVIPPTSLTFEFFPNTFTGLHIVTLVQAAGMSALTHFDETGASRMVDVGDKPVTSRMAKAGGRVTLQPATLKAILDRNIAKGNVLEVARLAGIMAAKKTAELIPLCHPLGLDEVDIRFDTPDDHTIAIQAEVRVQARTGVEMEALTAASVAALTIYDMCKSLDRGIVLGPFELLEKSGGKSGHFRRDSG